MSYPAAITLARNRTEISGTKARCDNLYTTRAKCGALLPCGFHAPRGGEKLTLCWQAIGLQQQVLRASTELFQAGFRATWSGCPTTASTNQQPLRITGDYKSLGKKRRDEHCYNLCNINAYISVCRKLSKEPEGTGRIPTCLRSSSQRIFLAQE